MPATRAWPNCLSDVPSSNVFMMIALRPAYRPPRTSTTLPDFIILPILACRSGGRTMKMWLLKNKQFAKSKHRFLRAENRVSKRKRNGNTRLPTTRVQPPQTTPNNTRTTPPAAAAAHPRAHTAFPSWHGFTHNFDKSCSFLHRCRWAHVAASICASFSLDFPALWCGFVRLFYLLSEMCFTGTDGRPEKEPERDGTR